MEISSEIVIYPTPLFRLDNMAKKKGAGFQSAAGLIRYFDQEDDKAIKINPWFVVAMSIIATVFVTYAHYAWPV